MTGIYECTDWNICGRLEQDDRKQPQMSGCSADLQYVLITEVSDKFTAADSF